MGNAGSQPISSGAVPVPVENARVNDEKFWRTLLRRTLSLEDAWGSPLTREQVQDEELLLRTFIETNSQFSVVETGGAGNCAIYALQTWVLYVIFLVSTDSLALWEKFYRREEGKIRFSPEYLRVISDNTGDEPFSIVNIASLRDSQTIRNRLQELLPRRIGISDRGGAPDTSPYNWKSTSEWIDDTALQFLGNIIYENQTFNITVYENQKHYISYYRNHAMQEEGLTYPDISELTPEFNNQHQSHLFNEVIGDTKIDGAGSLLLYNERETHFQPILPLSFQPPVGSDLPDDPRSEARLFLVFLICTYHYERTSDALRKDIAVITESINRNGFGMRVHQKLRAVEAPDNFGYEYYNDNDAVSRTVSRLQQILYSRAEELGFNADEEFRRAALGFFGEQLYSEAEIDAHFGDISPDIKLLMLIIHYLSLRYPVADRQGLLRVAQLIRRTRAKFHVQDISLAPEINI